MQLQALTPRVVIKLGCKRGDFYGSSRRICQFNEILKEFGTGETYLTLKLEVFFSVSLKNKMFNKYKKVQIMYDTSLIKHSLPFLVSAAVLAFSLTFSLGFSFFTASSVEHIKSFLNKS